MSTIHLHQTTTSTPEQYVAGLTDFGPGRSKLFGNSADDYLKVHDRGPSQADVTEGSGGIWERLHYDWSNPNHVVLTTTDSNIWGGASGHTYTFTRRPDGLTDIDVVVVRAKEFYARLGWRLDADFTAGDDWRGVQFTPPGSGCSVIFGKNVTTAAPGAAQGLYLAVSDIETTRKELLGRGVEVSEVFHGSNVHTGTDEPYLFGRLRVNGPDPAHTSYHSFASFHAPDGNGWLLQEV